jgi:hypothetical protein
MTTLTPQKPSIGSPVTPTFTAITAADKFAASGGSYVIWYRTAASSGNTTFWVLDGNNPGAVAPTGAQAPAVPTGATKWSDALIVSAMAATSDKVIAIDNINIQNFIDSTGFVNLKHNGTVTNITVAVLGPF